MALKRIFDLCFSILLLMFLTPFFLVVYILVFICLGRPVLFKQERPGLNGKIFQLYKFRTMSAAVDQDGSLLPDEVRLTAMGKILRKLSIDEIPSLINVIRGEMSFVGPRPLLVEYLDLYNPTQARRHNVLPGITGWAQVNGRNNLTWEKKFQLDVWYVDNQTFLLDMKILFLTFLYVLRARDIDDGNGVGQEKFTGE